MHEGSQHRASGCSTASRSLAQSRKRAATTEGLPCHVAGCMGANSMSSTAKCLPAGSKMEGSPSTPEMLPDQRSPCRTLGLTCQEMQTKSKRRVSTDCCTPWKARLHAEGTLLTNSPWPGRFHSCWPQETSSCLTTAAMPDSLQPSDPYEISRSANHEDWQAAGMHVSMK